MFSRDGPKQCQLLAQEATDIRQAATPRRFWAMLAHFHGQLWNGQVNLHELTRRVRDHRSAADSRYDYLVNSNPPVVGGNNIGKDLIPDTLYLSNDTTEAVRAVAPNDPNLAITPINTSGDATLTFAAGSGWTYLGLLEPSNGNRPVTAVRRANGSLLSNDTFWITDRTFPEHSRPTYESSLHILDHASSAGPASDTLIYGAPSSNTAPTVAVMALTTWTEPMAVTSM